MSALERTNCPQCFDLVADGYTFCSDDCERSFHFRSVASLGLTRCGNPECEYCEPKTMPELQWPPWVERRDQIALDAVLRLALSATAAARGEPHARNVATRDVVRAVGFTERNSVGVIADMIEKAINERINQ